MPMQWMSYFVYGDAGWGDELLSGLVVTLSLAFCALPLGLGLGIGVAFASMSKRPTLKWMALVFTTVIRGLPELLTLFIIYHGIGLLLNKGLNLFWPSVGYIEFSPFVAGTIALGLVFAG
ncbi:MAG: ABC transporter permease subunit, partial [Gammaproteobacteria bacterium]|nr:ABC transporter permease subunit [Gammaproteobacteria bacterium]